LFRAIESSEEAKTTIFAATGGGSARYETGSHIDLKGFSVMAGLARKLNEDLTAGLFAEAGWGNYDSYNSFNSAPSVKGDGNTNYYGLGLLGRYNLTETVYTEGSIRGGGTKTDFNTKDIGLSKVGYDSSAMYYGAHIGAGILTKISETVGIDLTAKAFYTYQGKDDTTIEGDKVKFESANSIRARIGTRANYEANKNLKPYIGAFFDYEFNGKAKAKVNGANIETPELRGATGVGELGIGITPNDTIPLTLDIGLQGYIGTREGFSASLYGKYMF